MVGLSIPTERILCVALLGDVCRFRGTRRWTLECFVQVDGRSRIRGRSWKQRSNLAPVDAISVPGYPQ